MKKLVIVIALAAIVLFGINDGFAQTSGHGEDPRSTQHQEHAYGPGRESAHYPEGMGGKDLSLTPEQKATFRELIRKFQLENAQLIGALVAKKIELMALGTDPEADPNTIIDKEKEFRDIKNQLEEKSIQYKLEARKSLTPEQIAKFGARWLTGDVFGRHYGLGKGGTTMGDEDMRGGYGKMGHGRMMDHGGMRRHMDHGGMRRHGEGIMGHGGMMGGGRCMCGGMGREMSHGTHRGATAGPGGGMCQ